jgi:hypothetical protein
MLRLGNCQTVTRHDGNLARVRAQDSRIGKADFLHYLFSLCTAAASTAAAE